MGLETFTNIQSLNELWPLGADSKSQGDDHLRGIKKVLKAEFASGGVAKTAQTRSRIVNGAMQISQENGSTAGNTSGYYAADQWYIASGSSGTITTQRVQLATPNGSKDRFRATITVADASLAAGDYLSLSQVIEGVRIADFRYGSASAKQSVLRFGFKAPAGTYSIGLRNNAQDRSYIANFTVSAGQANADTEQVFIIPGDTGGVWLTDTGIGMTLRIALAAGTTFQGIAGWQSGNVFGTSSNTNGMGVTNNVFELFDVGLYMDPDSTGVPPKWTMPDEAEELRACKRYYEKVGYLLTATASTFISTGYFIVDKRSQPALSLAPSSGTGAALSTFSGLGHSMAYYQSTGHSAVAQSTVTGNARM